MRALLIAAIAVLLGACNARATTEEISALKLDLAATKAVVASLETRLLQQQQSSQLPRRKPALLDPGSEGYSSMDTTIGPLLLVVESVKPMADGSQIALKVGNPHAVSLMGIDLTVTYGSRYEEGNYADWLSGLSSKEVSLPDPIYSGSWNNLKINLPKKKPDELGHIEISGDINHLSLTPR